MDSVIFFYSEVLGIRVQLETKVLVEIRRFQKRSLEDRFLSSRNFNRFFIIIKMLFFDLSFCREQSMSLW